MTSSNEQQAQRAAEQFRQEHHLGVQPLGDLIALIEQATGHDVAILDTEPDTHGLAMRDPLRGTVFIGVARTLNPMRQRSTLAHELGHVIFKDWYSTTHRRPEEIRADAFARHLLIPIDGLRGFLGSPIRITEKHLSSVVQHFLVSPFIAAIAMRSAGYISQDTVDQWRKYSTAQLATRYGWSDHYSVLQKDSSTTRAPQSLVARATEGYLEGVVSAQTIATLRGLPLADLMQEFHEAGIHPSTHEPIDILPEHLPPIAIDLSDLGDEENAAPCPTAPSWMQAPASTSFPSTKNVYSSRPSAPLPSPQQ
ncbi:ImmA/IrrE family metallo-endopeptidase [Corynebacterium oculi]|uniref:ImmA/IrrE family metallo-endopeptidase n=1 Tax=Corynebacterium oculi TaxID=1544416 RepID=UPI0009E6F0D5|nr:ImmA/IrrE family metallo-endopeptidase [Corynebacterium oculi]